MDLAQEIKKYYGRIYFDDPVIKFNWNQIVIDTKLTRWDNFNIIVVIVGLLALIVSLFIHKFYSLWWYFSAFVIVLVLLYTALSGTNKVKIDFFYKKIELHNKFLFVNIIRNILKIPTPISFPQVSQICNRKGPYFGRNQIRNFLTVKLFDHSSIKIARFRFEEDSKKLAELLNKYIVGEPRLNE